MDNIGERLKAVRIKRDMNQTQVATTIGVSQELIAKIELGQRTPNEDTLTKIQRWIVSGRGPNRPGAAKRGANKGYSPRGGER